MEAMRESTPKPQEMMMPEPRMEHRWLRKLVGEWDFQGRAAMGPDQPMEEYQGTETVRSIGELWITAEGRVEIPGGEPGINILTLGYDPDKGRFVGSFITSMMTYLWTYDGELDPDGRTLNLDTEGPMMQGGDKPATFRESIEMIDDDHRVWRSRIKMDDGSWQEVMRTDYRRRG